MNLTDRKEFLQKTWNKYPTLPLSCKIYGLVQKIDITDKIILTVNNVSFELDSTQQKNSDYKFIMENDIVAVDESGQLLLLAPSLAKSALQINLETQVNWNLFIQKIRSYFTLEKFIELQTPSLVVCPGFEPSLEVFQTEFQLGSLRKTFFLPTSPELSIKKIISQLVREKTDLNVFEIAKVFRNNEVTNRHIPEFFMLEWYRCFRRLEDIQKDIVNLVKILSTKEDLQIERASMKELFKKHLDFDLTPQTTFADLKLLADSLQMDCRNIDDFDDLFNFLFIEKIEFRWPKDKLFFLEKYPPSQAALARVDTEGWAERFEFYWQGYEIANAFHELNDPAVQQERIKKDLELKKKYGKKEISSDEKFIQALEYGMPPTSGVALGLERLFMALNNQSEIHNVHYLSRL